MLLIKRSWTMTVKLYKAIIKPNIEYGNVTSHPLYLRQIRLIKDVQRRATACIYLQYQDTLRELKLYIKLMYG